MSRVPEDLPAGGSDEQSGQSGVPLPDGPRASDTDRDRVVAVLRDHYVAGGITLEEFAQRTEIALAARSLNELEPLTSDLVPVTPVTPVEVPRRVRRPIRRTVAIMSGINRRGRWRIDGETVAISVMGGINLDLREAQLDPSPGSDEVVITAFSLMGGVNIIVPEGIPVEISGFSLMGGTEDRTSGTHLAGLPTVHVRAYSCMGGVTIRTAKPRRDRRRQVEDVRETIEWAQSLRHGHRDERRRLHDERKALRDEIRGKIHTERDRIREGGPPLPRGRPAHGGNLPPWLERVLQQALGPEGLDRIITERVAARLRASGLDPDAIRNSLEAVASWVSGERVDLRSVAAPDGTVTILFTDIEGSARITERLGDQQWIEVLRDHNRIIRELVREHGGSEVRSLGDGFMIVFSSARRALHCAVAIQRAFAEYALEHPDEPIRVRIGCHTGEAIRDADDFFGRNVVLAARVADQAKGGQILVSSVVKELTDSTGDVGFGEPREVVLDGLSGTRTVYEVTW